MKSRGRIGKTTATLMVLVVSGSTLIQSLGTGFPQGMEIMENLENHKKSSMHGKIMEFKNT